MRTILHLLSLLAISSEASENGNRMVFVPGKNCGVDNPIHVMTVGGRTVAGCSVVKDQEELYKLDPGTAKQALICCQDIFMCVSDNY